MPATGARVRSARGGDGAAGRARRHRGEIPARCRDRRRNGIRLPPLARGEPRGRVRRRWRRSAPPRCALMWRCRPSARRPIKEIAAELAKKNIVTLDSPVSGGPRGARAGTLSTMVAGEHAAFERVKPMLAGARAPCVLRRRQARHGPGGQARQQHDLGRRHAGGVRGLRDGGEGRRRCAHPDRDRERLDRPQQRHDGQVSGLRADAQLRLRRQGLDHVQGRAPLPGGSKAAQGADVARRQRGRDVAHGHGGRARRRRFHLADPDDREMGRRGGRRE